ATRLALVRLFRPAGRRNLRPRVRNRRAAATVVRCVRCHLAEAYAFADGGGELMRPRGRIATAAPSLPPHGSSPGGRTGVGRCAVGARAGTALGRGARADKALPWAESQAGQSGATDRRRR